MKNMIPLVIAVILGVSCVVSFQQNAALRQSVENLASAIEQGRANRITHGQMEFELARAAYDQDFFVSLSRGDARLWHELLAIAKDSPEGSVTKEYWDAGVTPIQATFKDVFNDIEYTVVVGTRAKKYGYDWYRPCFVVFMGDKHGRHARMDRLRGNFFETRNPHTTEWKVVDSIIPADSQTLQFAYEVWEGHDAVP